MPFHWLQNDPQSGDPGSTPLPSRRKHRHKWLPGFLAATGTCTLRDSPSSSDTLMYTGCWTCCNKNPDQNAWPRRCTNSGRWCWGSHIPTADARLPCSCNNPNRRPPPVVSCPRLHYYRTHIGCDCIDTWLSDDLVTLKRSNIGQTTRGSDVIKKYIKMSVMIIEKYFIIIYFFIHLYQTSTYHANIPITIMFVRCRYCCSSLFGCEQQDEYCGCYLLWRVYGIEDNDDNQNDIMPASVAASTRKRRRRRRRRINRRDCYSR